MNRMGGYPGFAPMLPRTEEPPLIQVTGEGRLQVVPDTAVVSLGVTARGDQAAGAFQQAAATVNRIIRALQELGIPPEQVQTGQIGLYPVYEENRLVGYEANATLQVTLPELEAAGAVIDRAVAAGANRVQGITFEVRDPGPYEARAWAMAVQDAQQSAAVLARSLGVALGPVWRVRADPAPGPIVPLRAQPFGVAEAAIPILPGTLELARRVLVEYRISYM